MELAALVDPALKTGTFVKVCNILLEQEAARVAPIATNLGIAGAKLVDVPPEIGAPALFGRPDSHGSERGALHAMLALLRHSDAFVDIGAHRGIYSLLAHVATHGAVPVHFCEPMPYLFNDLSRTVESNELDAMFGHQLAIGDTNGQASFYVCERVEHTASLLHSEGTSEISVKVETFDSFARRLGLDNLLVKVDIENAETKFLDGARQENRRIKYLLIELLGPAIGQGVVNRIRREFGMHAYYIHGMTLEHSADGSFDYEYPEWNWLFCRESPEQLRGLLADSKLAVSGSSTPRTDAQQSAAHR